MKSPRIWLLTVLLVFASPALFFTVRQDRSTHPKSELELSARNLVRRDGCWLLPDGTNLFTGWLVEAYTNHTPRARSSIVNGKLNGLSEGWYREGQIQIREYFHDNLSHGSRQKWYPNGALMSEASVVEGNLQGTFQRWFENGQLAERLEMKDGKPDGLALAYYPSGFLQARTWASRGTILRQETWNDGERREPPASRGESSGNLLTAAKVQ